ncbi:MAG TPA: hypothetical protein EYG60_01550, partial [Campylobacterales bacterium]|nr:hypothetical protein [Campylobacterales bacterium]
MKKFIVGTLIGTSTIFASSTDGFSIGVGFGSTSTTTTAEGYSWIDSSKTYYQSDSVDESG